MSLILENLLGSLFFGGVISILLTCLVFLACMMISRKTVQTPISILVIAVYFVYATVFGSLIVGGMYAKTHVEKIGTYVAELMDEETETTSPGVIKNELIQTYASYGFIIDQIDINSIVNIAQSGQTSGNFLAQIINEKIDDYIQEWSIWLLFGALMATIFASAVLRNSKGNSQNIDLSTYGFDNDTTTSEYY